MRHRLFTLFFVLGALLSAHAALAQKSADIQAAFYAGDLARKAGEGDPVAATELGYLYQTGQDGLKKSYEQAFSYYQMAANEDYAEAETYLGFLYTNGLGTTQNYGMAVQWFNQAVAHGNVNAEYNLGNLYFLGNGVKQDYAKAVEYYRMAAETGKVEAEYALGTAYLEGKGVTKNDADAAKWLRLAADQGDARAERHMAELYKAGKGAQGTEANVASMFDLYKKAALKGDPDAQYNYAVMIETGAGGLTADIDTALKWYWKAANQGKPEAQHALGKAFYTGKGTQRDYRQAWFWFALAAKYSHKAGYNDDRDEAAEHVPAAELDADAVQVALWRPTH